MRRMFGAKCEDVLGGWRKLKNEKPCNVHIWPKKVIGWECRMQIG
jgi:hypothetical protein